MPKGHGYSPKYSHYGKGTPALPKREGPPIGKTGSAKTGAAMTPLHKGNPY